MWGTKPISEPELHATPRSINELNVACRWSVTVTVARRAVNVGSLGIESAASNGVAVGTVGCTWATCGGPAVVPTVHGASDQRSCSGSI